MMVYSSVPMGQIAMFVYLYMTGIVHVCVRILLIRRPRAGKTL